MNSAAVSQFNFYGPTYFNLRQVTPLPRMNQTAPDKLQCDKKWAYQNPQDFAKLVSKCLGSPCMEKDANYATKFCPSILYPARKCELYTNCQNSHSYVEWYAQGIRSIPYFKRSNCLTPSRHQAEKENCPFVHEGDLGVAFNQDNEFALIPHHPILPETPLRKPRGDQSSLIHIIPQGPRIPRSPEPLPCNLTQGPNRNSNLSFTFPTDEMLPQKINSLHIMMKS